MFDFFTSSEVRVPAFDRRSFLQRSVLTVGAVSGAAACSEPAAPAPTASPAAPTPPAPAPLPHPRVRLERLGAPPWPTADPFLFCVHHLDRFPAGDARQGPSVPLTGRAIGQDFSNRDGWSMYHGDVVPGFPRHPHRGFETVTVSRRGFIDHSDSLGATARYGGGDVQWMTAGRGIAHAEMFPLRRQDGGNTAELFQIWLNLPRAKKLVPPYFTMMWRDAVPVHRLADAEGRAVEVTTVAGALDPSAGPRPAAPPPDSWASSPEAEVAIWTLKLAPGARFTLPAASPGVTRSLYVFAGDRVVVGDTPVPAGHRAVVEAHLPAALEAGAVACELLMLQGRPLGEPVVAHGPFVMNSREEIVQAFADYRRDGFGRWPWGADDPVHPREQERFALHADGRRDVPTG